MSNLPPLMSNALEVLRDYVQSPISTDQSERHGTAWVALNQLQFCCHQLQEQVDDGLLAAKERNVAEQRATQYVQALGLFSTLAPEVPVGFADPIDMAKAIEQSVLARLDKAKTEKQWHNECANLRDQNNSLKKSNDHFRAINDRLREGLAARRDALEHVANHVGHYGILLDDPAKLARTIVAEFDSRVRSRDARIDELDVRLASAEYSRDDAVARIAELEAKLCSAEAAFVAANLRNAQAEPYNVEKAEAAETALEVARAWLREGVRLLRADKPRGIASSHPLLEGAPTPRGPKGDEEGQS